MCRAVTCNVCGKTTWAGCGQHIESVRSSVPANQWCPGHPAAERPKSRSFSGLFGRR
jgi:hypothetical protein